MKAALNKRKVNVEKELSSSICQNIIKAYEKGELLEHIEESALSIEKDEDNNITYILFTYGGPTVYLDFEDSPGVVIASHMSDEAHSAIPLAIWSDIRNELEVL